MNKKSAKTMSIGFLGWVLKLINNMPVLNANLKQTSFLSSHVVLFYLGVSRSTGYEYRGTGFYPRVEECGKNNTQEVLYGLLTVKAKNQSLMLSGCCYVYPRFTNPLHLVGFHEAIHN